MYLVREVVNCRPGKVRPMVEKFRMLSGAIEELGEKPFRLLTDLSGESFWTVVLEAEVERVEDFIAYEQKLMENPAVRESMAGHHDLILGGRREIYRIEQ